MRKIMMALMLLISGILFASSVLAPAKAFSTNACNNGTMNAHMNGMPSSEAGGHDVPGLQHTPFAGSEVPGHMHVPEC